MTDDAVADQILGYVAHTETDHDDPLVAVGLGDATWTSLRVATGVERADA